MKTFNIYKKRDGQGFKEVSYIYAENFEDAKKQFALSVTNDNWNMSNDIQWLTVQDGAEENGWYDFSGSPIEFDEEIEKYNPESLKNNLFCSEEAIKNGFSSWNEDVYTWEIRNNFEVEIWADGELYTTENVESIEEAESLYPVSDGFTIIEI